ncbi:hypothetical protein RYX36_020976 [Vicia faba]
METLIMMSQETPYQILNPWRQNTPADDDAMKEKILKLGICLLRGSEKATAKELISRITLAMSKLKHGTNTEDILNVDAKITVNSSGKLVVASEGVKLSLSHFNTTSVEHVVYQQVFPVTGILLWTLQTMKVL